MKFSELQRLQRREGITALSSDARIEQLEAQLCTITKERDALRAKIEQMERQGPVATVRINAINGNPSVDFVPGHRYLHHNDKLYLAPGAQPAPSAPELLESLRCACNYIDKLGGVSQQYRALLAAAPEAKCPDQ